MVVLLTGTPLIGETMLLLLWWTKVSFEGPSSTADVTYPTTIVRPRMVFLHVRIAVAMVSVCHDPVVNSFED